MLSSIQFSKFKKSADKSPKPPKVKNGGSYKYPTPGPTREERDLMESKARINNAKSAKLNREAQNGTFLVSISVNDQKIEPFVGALVQNQSHGGHEAHPLNYGEGQNA